MPKKMPGRIGTFYSYKGGGGRSMALANVAWALASTGKRVLAIDWDFEAPGLHRYFHPFLEDPEQVASNGMIDRLWEYVEYLASPNGEIVDPLSFADLSNLVQELEIPPEAKGHLHFIGAGLQDETYSSKVSGFDWNGLYSEFGGAALVDEMAEWARSKYDWVLIDSRTGVSDSAGICTVQFPDILVLCFIYNRQSIEGVTAIAKAVQKQRSNLSLILSPMRVEIKHMANHARRFAAEILAPILKRSIDQVELEFRQFEVPHYSWCGFEEKLAVFEEVPGENGSLLEAMHRLAGRIDGRGELQPITIPRSALKRVWRRAAFSDSRLADLDALKEGSGSEASTQLRVWLDEALKDKDYEREEWLEALTHACLLQGVSADGLAGVDDAEMLSSGALQLASHLYERNKSYIGLLAKAYSVRSDFLRNQRQLAAALDVISRAIYHLQGSNEIAINALLGRALEEKAAIHEELGGTEESIAAYRQALDVYKSIPPTASATYRSSPDITRTELAIIRMLLRAGAHDAAVEAAESALRRLENAGEGLGSLSHIRSLMLLAEAQLKAGQNERGLDVINAAVLELKEHQSQHAAMKGMLISALTTKGKIQRSQGSRQEALATINEAATLTQSSAASNIAAINIINLWIERGALLFEMGEAEDALNDLRAALQRAEGPAYKAERIAILELMTKIYTSLNRKREAELTTLQTLIETFGENSTGEPNFQEIDITHIIRRLLSTKDERK